MKNYIKTVIVYLARFILRFGYIFPVQRKRIIFSSYEGMKYTCNPKYIFQDLFDKFGDELEYIWVLNNPDDLPQEYQSKVKTVRYLSIKHIFYLLTSGTIINNLGIEPIIPKRKAQAFINTWHGGGAYKIVSPDMNIFSKSETFYIRHMRNIRRKGTDIVLSSCKKFTEVSSKDFDIPAERFVPSGLPRNDRFFDMDNEQIILFRNKITQIYNIPTENILVLYAPTFRGTHRKQLEIDKTIFSREVVDAIQEKFGRPVSFLFRSHISKEKINSKINDTTIHVVDLSEYPDIQDLLYIADILITDYSSSIWDYCITGKPGFLYVPDVKEYIANRGFYTPISTWPYPYSVSVKELCEQIRSYSKQVNLDKIIAHQNTLGSYEKGNSNNFIVNLLSKRINK